MLSQPQGHSAAGRIMSMKNCNGTIGNRTRDLRDCSGVSQPTAPPGAPSSKIKWAFIERRQLQECVLYIFVCVQTECLLLCNNIYVTLQSSTCFEQYLAHLQEYKLYFVCVQTECLLLYNNIYVTLQSSTCFEQYLAHLQEYKLYYYSLWYRHSL